MMKAKAPVIIFILLILFFSPMLFNRYVLDGDLADEYMPKLFTIGESLRTMAFPTGEKGMGLGFPLYKDIQSGLFYPLNWLFVLPFDFLRLVQSVIFLNAFLFACGLLLLFRRLYPDPAKHLVLSVAVLFGGFFVSHAAHYTMLCSMAVSPFFIYFYIRFLEERKRHLFSLSVLFGVLLISAGHPQIFFLVLILCAILTGAKSKGIGSFVNPFMVFVFIFFISLFIIAPTLSLLRYSFRADDSMVYNLMPFKYLVLLVFPNLFGGSSLIGYRTYSGILNINEVQFYSSLLLLFAFSYFLKRVFFDRDYRYALRAAIPLIFLLLSYFTEFNLHVFLTPGRSMGFAVISFMALCLPDAVEKHDGKTLLVFSSVFAFFLVIALARGASLLNLLLPAFLFGCYLLLFIFSFKNKKLALMILPFLLFADLYLSLGRIISYSDRGGVENVQYPELKEKYIITYLPDEVVFYSGFLKEHFKENNLEKLKRYSACGSRGVYYKAYSYNLYQNFTFAKYVDFFSDRAIMSGGFSNINFIMNPLFYDYDYIFIPDMPAFFNVTGALLIPYREDMRDTFYAYYTGEIRNIRKADSVPGIPYLSKVKGLRKGILAIDGETMLEGEGKIIMLADVSTGETVLFPRLFGKMNFEEVGSGPFTLFKRQRKGGELDFMTSPIDGSFMEGRKNDYVPMDFLGGLFMSILSLITMFTYGRKELK